LPCCFNFLAQNLFCKNAGFKSKHNAKIGSMDQYIDLINMKSTVSKL